MAVETLPGTGVFEMPSPLLGTSCSDESLVIVVVGSIELAEESRLCVDSEGVDDCALVVGEVFVVVDWLKSVFTASGFTPISASVGTLTVQAEVGKLTNRVAIRARRLLRLTKVCIGAPFFGRAYTGDGRPRLPVGVDLQRGGES